MSFGWAGELGIGSKPGAAVGEAARRRLGRTPELPERLTAVERLLSISGEDTLTVNRKYNEQERDGEKIMHILDKEDGFDLIDVTEELDLTRSSQDIRRIQGCEGLQSWSRVG